MPIATVPPLCPPNVSLYDYTRCGELIDRAAATMTAWLTADGLAGTGIPGTLRAHDHNEDHPNYSADFHGMPAA